MEQNWSDMVPMTHSNQHSDHRILYQLQLLDRIQLLVYSELQQLMQMLLGHSSQWQDLSCLEIVTLGSKPKLVKSTHGPQLLPVSKRMLRSKSYELVSLGRVQPHPEQVMSQFLGLTFLPPVSLLFQGIMFLFIRPYPSQNFLQAPLHSSSSLPGICWKCEVELSIAFRLVATQPKFFNDFSEQLYVEVKKHGEEGRILQDS